MQIKEEKEVEKVKHTSSVESVTLSESFMGRISSSLRLPPKNSKNLSKIRKFHKVKVTIRGTNLQYLITAILTGAMHVTDCCIFN